ncbi:hypothetical protein EST38_g13947 [Candolleomyces aberdarensis]|uniref:Uncharacterized protein n=1 Tax=Candolleomyces aberdarensis TaxID=2316362 RepID=A0A4V1Q1K5_9AGAR|nr:hypothetical protein EST38_g13947 [Candolleomyces aberdarensis]
MSAKSKTHTDAARVTEISAMSRYEKKAENVAIRARNGVKRILRKLKANGAKDLSQFIEDLEPKVNEDSDLESLISISDEADDVPLPPDAPGSTVDFKRMLGDLTSAIKSGLKRPTSPSRELESTLAKKLRVECRPELDLDTSQVLDPSVAREVDMLDHAGLYCQLGLFTREGMEFVSFHANSIKTVRATIDVDGKATTIRVIDADHKRIPKEHTLSQRDWYGATGSHVLWAQNVKKDDRWARWLVTHYEWCMNIFAAQGSDYDFTCVLLVDILMRKKYFVQPFMFKPGMHKDLLNEVRQDYRMAYDKAAFVLAKLGIVPDSKSSLPLSFPSQSPFPLIPPINTLLPINPFLPNPNIFNTSTPNLPPSPFLPPLLPRPAALNRTVPNPTRGVREDLPAASYAAEATTRRTRVPLPQKSTAPLSTAVSRTEFSARSTATTRSARDGTSAEPWAQAATLTTGPSTCAPSAAQSTSLPSALPASSVRLDAPRSPITGELLPLPLPDPLSSTNSDILNRICTPYVADAFDSLFDKFPTLREEFPHLTQKLREGFPMGVFPELTETVIFPNNKSINQHMDFVDQYFKEEVESGRMSGPYSKEELEGILGGPFQCSPIAIDKKEVEGSFKKKLRLCINLSKSSKSQPSTNSYSDKEDFPTKYDTAEYVLELISSSPPGTQAMVLDISKFHRRTPICPAHKRWFVMQVASESNSAPMPGAVLRIWRLHGIGPSAKWSDDVSSLHYPSSGDGSVSDPFVYDYDRDRAMELTASTGIPWHEDKGQDFASSFTYVGLLWDIDTRHVSLPEEKRKKFLYRAESFLAFVKEGGKVSEEWLMKLHGSLCHIAFVHRLGRSRLPSLSSFISRFANYPPSISLHPPPSLISDVGWWVQQLRIPNLSRSLVSLGDPLDLGISVDASTDWGIGLVWGNEWDAWRLAKSWKGPGRDIGWLECLALELLVLHLEAKGLKDCRVRVQSDNQGIIGAYYKGRSRNFEVNFSIRRFMYILDALHVSLDVVYVKSADNPADPISRGNLGPGPRRISSKFELPEELRPHIFHA